MSLVVCLRSGRILSDGDVRSALRGGRGGADASRAIRTHDVWALREAGLRLHGVRRRRAAHRRQQVFRTQQVRTHTVGGMSVEDTNPQLVCFSIQSIH